MPNARRNPHPSHRVPKVIGKLPRPVRLLSKNPLPSLAWKEAVGRNKSEGIRAVGTPCGGRAKVERKRSEEKKKHVLRASLLLSVERKSDYCWWSVEQTTHLL
jgi:hypothetical protein